MPNLKDPGTDSQFGGRKTGPKTPEGKLRSSMNAFKTGKYSRSTFVLRHEDKAAFEALAQSLVRRYQPEDAVEYNLIRQLASVEWRLHRVFLMDTAVTDREFEVKSAALEQSAAEAADGAPEHVAEPLTLGLVTHKLLENSRLPQYLASRESQLLYARNAILQTLNQLRKGYPLSGPCRQIIDPMDLKPDNSFKNEFETNLPSTSGERQRPGAEHASPEPASTEPMDAPKEVA